MKICENRDDVQYVLSLSYGKDSLACLEACKLLGQRIDRIVHAEVWATDTIPADLPPMVDFKKKADEIIKERYGIEVEHICAMRKAVFPQTLMSGMENSHMRNTSIQDHQEETSRLKMEQLEDSRFNEEVGARSSSMESGLEKLTYEKVFYRQLKPTSKTYLKRVRGGNEQSVDFLKSKGIGVQANSKHLRYGFPQPKGSWCTGELKTRAMQENIPNKVQILGIAVDEPKRIERHKDKALLPLVDIGWTEADCRKWCEENDLLSPIYTDSLRGGCWFCHNQGVQQLRLLRKNYPELWEILLKWDADSPVSFHPDGHTVHDFDKRFALEDEGLIKPQERFKWDSIKYTQLRLDTEDL